MLSSLFLEAFCFHGCIFHESVSFFSPSQPYLHGEIRCESEDEVALPLPDPLYLFDVDGWHGKEET